MLKTKKEIKDWLDHYEVIRYTINEDLTVDIDGDVNLFNKNIIEIPIQFNIVYGSFYCGNNNLTSLEGCPKEVDGYFNCDGNELISLEGCPLLVTGSFDCSNNQLSSLKGCPEIIRYTFICSNNQLESLEGCPKEIGGDFWCNDNELSSLDFLPKKVGGGFICNKNKLLGKIQEITNFNTICMEYKKLIITKNKENLETVLDKKSNEIEKKTMKI